MEIDRQGNRYDEFLKSGGIPSYLNGDYYYYDEGRGAAAPAPWDASGVLEIDCLMCHMEGYSSFARAAQTGAERFYAAPSAGAGMGQVIHNARVLYDPNLAAQGIALNPSVHRQNCAQCHAMDEKGFLTSPDNLRSDVKKRGFMWGDISGVHDDYKRDVHDSHGKTCTFCHEADLEHQIAKGHIRASTVREDLDFTVNHCGDCHDGGIAEDPTEDHEKAGFGGGNAFHMERIDCLTCHVPFKDTTAVRTIETAGGAEALGQFNYGLWANGIPADPGSWTPKGLMPAYNWWLAKDGNYKIFPMNVITVLLWSEKDLITGQPSYAVFPRDLMAAAAQATIDDDNHDGKPEVNLAPEIKSMRDELAALGHPEINDPRLWVIPHFFSMSHNVRGDPLGEDGCADCHSPGSHIFDGGFMLWHYEMEASPYLESHLKIVLKDGTSEEIPLDFAQPGHNYIPNWKLLGYTQQERDELVKSR